MIGYAAPVTDAYCLRKCFRRLTPRDVFCRSSRFRSLRCTAVRESRDARPSSDSQAEYLVSDPAFSREIGPWPGGKLIILGLLLSSHPDTSGKDSEDPSSRHVKQSTKCPRCPGPFVRHEVQESSCRATSVKKKNLNTSFREIARKLPEKGIRRCWHPKCAFSREGRENQAGHESGRTRRNSPGGNERQSNERAWAFKEARRKLHHNSWEERSALSPRALRVKCRPTVRRVKRHCERISKKSLGG